MDTLKVGRSKRAASLKQDIEFHSDNGPQHAAINVKYYGRWPECDDLSPDDTQGIWERVCEQFWDKATDIAHTHGYSSVFSEGRSSGWLVPFYQTLGDGRKQFHNWPGQGPRHGYPQYPDVTNDKAEDRRFRAFRFDIEQLLAGVLEAIKSEIEFLRELKREAAQAELGASKPIIGDVK